MLCYIIHNNTSLIIYFYKYICVECMFVCQGKLRIGAFALRDIKQDEELSFDYKWSMARDKEPTVCYCGTDKCRGK